MKIGILGGTIDPIHYGHLVAAGCSMEEYALDKVIFVPAAQPPHKTVAGTVAGDNRYRMVELAIADLPGFVVSDIEFKRPGRSYTVDTLTQFKNQYPADELFFIMGEDTYAHFAEWKSPEEILRLAVLLVVSRPGPNSAAQTVPEEESRVRRVCVPGIDISSSDLRARIRTGRTVKFLLNDAVANFIRKHELYQESADEKSVLCRD
jgi:nicotinate-nucleotide adenylyltransferase